MLGKRTKISKTVFLSSFTLKKKRVDLKHFLNFKNIFILSFFYAFTLAQGLNALTLKEALEVVVKNQKKTKSIDFDLESINQQKKSLDGQFDTQINAKTYVGYNRNLSQNLPTEKIQSFSREVSVMKKTSWGTQFNLSYNSLYSDMDFGSSGTFVQNPMPLASITNPFYQTSLEFKVQHPLYRNNYNQEYLIQKKIFDSQKQFSSYEKNIFLQNIQSEVEHLFLQYTFLEEQIDNMLKLVEESKILLSLITKDIKIGLSETKDEISAQSDLIELKGQLLGLEIERNKISISLLHKVYAGTPPKNITIEQISLKDAVSSFPATNAEEALKHALQKRFDFKKMKQSKDKIKLEMNLLEESKKTDINAFLSYKSNNIDGEFYKSLSGTLSQEHPNITIGVNLNYNIDKTSYNTKKKEFINHLEKVDTEQSIIIDTIKSQLEVSYYQKNSADLQIKQYKDHITALEKIVAEEKLKIKQARSNDTNLSRYKMNIYRAQTNLLKSWMNKRSAEVQIKNLCHSYSS
ncbi:MAG: hypothetical protein CMP11_09460 [Zetaproteobacteria bacterium]|nr:hypothetical protein [Pseudobdellovibrionaceae bacterium]|tara:strand:- start:327 stop:1883 length:1557 start_codon:yes stop_codon:yes gene_type:complete